jgi:hypothetical protein
MRWIGIIAIVIVLVGMPVGAVDEREICAGLSDGIAGTREESGVIRGSPGQGQTLLTSNECEALRRREARVPLLEFPQEDEDPMSLSIGTKGDGGTLRFKIPFSF